MQNIEPGDVPAFLPEVPEYTEPHEENNEAWRPSSARLIGATTAGTRALASQLFTFYIRVPVKLFRPTRVDYLALPRALSPNSDKPWSFRTHSSPALIANAVKQHGWGFIPNQLLPPLLANSAVGLVLYSTYLGCLPLFKSNEDREKEEAEDEHQRQLLLRKSWYDTQGMDSSHVKYIIDELMPHRYTFKQTFLAGAVAGAAQAVAAAPIDAIYRRSSIAEVLKTKQLPSMWSYGMEKLRQTGAPGVFAGFTLSVVKESLGFGVFFATFEMVKGSWYRSYAKWLYEDRLKEHPTGFDENGKSIVNKVLAPFSILVAGAAATISLHVVQFPLQKLQGIYLTRLDTQDIIDARKQLEANRSKEQKTQNKLGERVKHQVSPASPFQSTFLCYERQIHHRNPLMVELSETLEETLPRTHSLLVKFGRGWSKTVNFSIRCFTTMRYRIFPGIHLYYRAYVETLITANNIRKGLRLSWPRYLYHGCGWTTLSALPSTSIGLFVFEIMRLRFGEEDDPPMKAFEA